MALLAHRQRHPHNSKNTVNSDFFLRGFHFHQTSHMQSFVKIKPLRNDEITLMWENHALVVNFNAANTSFHAIRKNKTLMK